MAATSSLSKAGDRALRSAAAGRRLSFRANLENWAEGMDYCAVAVPAEITESLGTKGPVLVLAQVNESAPFQVSLFPVGGGRHYIRIKAKVRREANVKTGDRVRVDFTVLDRGAVEVPDDLISALMAAKATEAFDALPPGQRNFIVRRIEDAARQETRDKRIQQGVEAAQERREKSMDRDSTP